MIDLDIEEVIPFAAAARHVPGRPHISTLHRWRLKGVRGVRLETLLIGGRRFTTRQALERFFAATTAIDAGEGQVTRTPRQRNSALAEAERQLDAAGI